MNIIKAGFTHIYTPCSTVQPLYTAIEGFLELEAGRGGDVEGTALALLAPDVLRLGDGYGED